jgi:hypothetical protein
MSILLQDAWNTAQRMLDSGIRPMQPKEIVIATVLEHEKAWAFSYNSRAFLAEGDFMSSLVGNGPIVVPKDGRRPFLASSAERVETQLDRL